MCPSQPCPSAGCPGATARIRVIDATKTIAARPAPEALRLDDLILETRGLTKEFRGFAAVQGVDLKIRRGTIHALIGPNGAGKTTVFNLLTNSSSPRAGRIIFNGDDITARARRPQSRGAGMVRSFQISAVFPHLIGARECARGAAAHARQLVSFLALGARARPARRARRGAARRCRPRRLRASSRRCELPMAASARSRSPPPWRSSPRCCCSTSRWPGSASEDIGRISALIREAPRDRTVLMVEHNLSVVADLSRHHHRADARPRAGRGRAMPTVSANRRGASRPISGPAMPEATVGGVAAARGRGSARLVRRIARPARHRASPSREGEVVTLLGRNGAGKTTTLRAIMGIVRPAAAARCGSRARDRSRLASNRIARLGIAYCPEERGIFASLIGRGEPAAAAGGAAGRHERRRDLRALSQSRRSGGAARAPSCRAASSRCWRSAASCAPARACCCSTSRPRGWRRSSCSRSAR